MKDSKLVDWMRRLASPPPVDSSLRYAVDRFAAFEGIIHIVGWVFAPGRAVRSVSLCFPNGPKFVLGSYGQPSPDVAAIFGDEAVRARFDEKIVANQSQVDVPWVWLEVELDGGTVHRIENFGMPGPEDHGVQIQSDFAAMLKGRRPGRFLEIGSRARSGIVRRDLAPPGWTYCGLDIKAGENVDVVGDAHKLSRLFEPSSFDAVTAMSVIEHLLMPWKFVIELNKVMKVGGIGLILTHQCWPMHDVPWDYWRFSDTAWTALFNRRTGYEIVRAALGSPALVVPIRCNPVTNFGWPPASYLASSVLFRKVGETTLEWPVEIEDVTDTQYPSA